MAFTELNDPSTYEITSLTHEMGKASQLSFYVLAEDPDATTPAFPKRTEVKFTVSGVVWFHGRTLPARRTIRKGKEVLEYTAADPLEFLGNNPCASNGLGVSEWYNRNAVDVTAFAWPSGQTVQQIITAELASVVGAGKQIGALDFSKAGTAASVVPSEFQTKGKTWLGLIEALVNESPGLGYWYDPTTISDAGSPVTRGTLRFYDLSTLGLSATRKVATLARRDGASSSGANVEDCEIVEDITQSYDTVIVRGWGDMTERYDAATPAWTALAGAAAGNSGPYLRNNTTTGKVEVFKPGPVPAGGSWVAEDTVSPRPWFPESTAPGYKSVGRRFSVPAAIADIRITRKDSTSPAVYQRDPQSMWVFTLQNVWDIGQTQWWGAGGTQLHVGTIVADLKIMDFSGGLVDDDGNVLPNPQAYGNPVTVTEPRFNLPTPTAYDSKGSTGYFILKEPLMRRTTYLFSGTQDPNYANMMGQVVFKWWPTYDYVWFKYTSTATLESTKQNLSLGFGKTLLLYDQRLVKYTNADGAVIKDDSSALSAAAQAIFDFVSRVRVYGSLTLDTDPDKVMTDWPIGFLVRLANWGADGATYDLPAVIQGIELTGCRDERRVKIRFDRENTFKPLEKLIQARDFYEGDSVVGDSGLSGRRGQRANPNPKPKSKKPNDVGGGQDPTVVNGKTISTKDPQSGVSIVRGKITARSTARGKASAVNYTAQTIDGLYTTAANSKPKLRAVSEGTVIFAAEVGSDCTIELVPRTDNSGAYDAQILSVHERTNQWLVKGHITSRTAAQSTPPNILYNWVSDDGIWTGTNSRPMFAPYNDAPLVDAATADATGADPASACEIMIFETAAGSPLAYSYDARLWSCQEKLHFDLCVPGGFTFLQGDGNLDSEAIIVSASGEEVVTPGGEVVVADGYDWPEGVETGLIVGADNKVVHTPNWEAVVSGAQTDVQPTYYDTTLTASYAGYDLTVSVVASVPAIAVTPEGPVAD